MSRDWPSREEWAARAEHAVRTACYPMERVPEGAENYLSEDEVAEMDRLYVELSKSARAPLTAEIKRLLGTLPSPPPARPLDRSHWYDTLTPTQQGAWQVVQQLRNARLEIGRRANGQTYKLLTWMRSPLDYSVLSPIAAPHLPDQVSLARLAELEALYTSLREVAADAALAAAIARTVAERNSDEGWAKELERRARLDGNHVITPAGPPDLTPKTTEETANG